MELLIHVLQEGHFLLPAVLWASIMTTLCLAVLYLTVKTLGNLVNPRLIYALWLLLGVRMFLLMLPLNLPVEYTGFAGSIGKYLVLIWFGGVVVTCATFCIQHARHYRDILRWETKLPEWLHSLFMEVREEVQLRVRPTLIVTEATTEPLLMGTFRPVVVLPVGLVQEGNRENLRQVLRHEMAHLSGGDLWFAWFWTVAMSLHWFNPFIWLARRTLGLWREIACDWRVTRCMSERERLEYGRTLLVVAQSSSGSNWCGAACVAEKSCDIERRITMISKKFPKMKKRFLSNAALGTVAFLFFVGTLCLPYSQGSVATAAQNGPAKVKQSDKVKQNESEPRSDVPKIAKLIPENGAQDVDPKKVTLLRVTFDRNMSTKSYSWCGGGPSFPEVVGKPKWIKKRTCILPVKLEPGKTYRLGINAPSFKNFRSAKGVPVAPVVYSFTTSGESSGEEQEVEASSNAPKVVKFSPENKAKDVDPKAVTELRVTFDRDMDRGGFSLCGGGPLFPEPAGKPKWTDKRTCVFPVKLKPGIAYQMYINAKRFKNFKSAKGVPVVPVPYSFTTAEDPSGKTDNKVDGKPIPLELLKKIRDKRAAIRSADYSVQSVMTGLPEARKSNSHFRFQGEDQWLVDISEKMQAKVFQGGCDGSQEWAYGAHGEDPSHYFYKIRSLADIKEKQVDLLDPFLCRNMPDAELKSYCDQLTAIGYRYLGVQERNGKKLYLFARVPSWGKNISIAVGLDPETLLPSYVQTKFKTPVATIQDSMNFQIHALNKKYSKADFQQENPMKLKPEKITEPDSGYSEFYVTIDDGAGGAMTVRFNGQKSESGGRSSSGLN